jgi:Uma2 family endonuclease
MTRKTDRLDRLARTIADGAQREPKPHRYPAEAVCAARSTRTAASAASRRASSTPCFGAESKGGNPVRNRATLPAMNLAVPKPMSLTEFLEWEERQERRYEFDGVEAVAMAGGSAAHADIQANITTALRNRLRGKPCKFFGSDLKILVGDNSSRYTDGMVVCSPVPPNATTVRDPVVIFEVLSPSTAAKDRIVKAREYQATPSVERYVMLEQDRIGATVHVRAQNGWSVLVLKDNDTLVMPEISLEVPLAEFYEGVEFEGRPDEDNDRPEPAPPDRS